jgi:hypothetical protein
MKPLPWSDQDLKQMKSLGITPAEVSRQLDLFKNPPPFIAIDRPAKPRDGILRLGPGARRLALRNYQSALRKGRLLKFVPASGAASRMFHLLTKFLQREPFSHDDLKRETLRGQAESREFLGFMEQLSRMAFFDEIGQVLIRKNLDLDTLRREGRFQEILEALLLPEGLNYSQKPKGLIQFHHYGSERRTPMEEQLVEAAHTVRDKSKRARIHFTVSEEHEAQSRGHFMEVREKYEKRHGVEFDIRFSTQSARTNTLAVDEKNRPFRDGEGRLVFRPSGHGALLENLNRLRGDLVFIKNIDNVTMEHRLDPSILWKKVLAGFLTGVQERVFQSLKTLSGKRVRPRDLFQIAAFARRELFLDLGLGFKDLDDARKKVVLKKLLDRPIRVCGVVRNTGEPGGGPFWVRGKDGRKSLQIVESAQINLGRKDQQALFRKSTHFNPVDLVCAVRDWKGKPFDLRRFRDPQAVFISKKSMGGRELKALELPGLWNGAMADWITLFVEVPLETFNPVKTVFDLLKPAHQFRSPV